AAGNRRPPAVGHPLSLRHRQAVLLPEAPHRRAGTGGLGEAQGGERHQRALPCGGGRGRADGAGAVQRAGVPSLGLARRQPRFRRPRGVRPRSRAGRAVLRSKEGRGRHPPPAGGAGTRVVPARDRRQGPARGGAAGAWLRLGADQALRPRLRRRPGQVRTGPFRRHRDQALPQPPHLRRLPAQRSRRHRGGFVLAARPSRSAGGHAHRLERTGAAAACGPVHDQGRAGEAASAAQGSLGPHGLDPPEPGALGAQRMTYSGHRSQAMQHPAPSMDGVARPQLASSPSPSALRRARWKSDERPHAMTDAAAPPFSCGADHLLLQGVTDYAISMLDASGNILSWNTGGQRIKGYTGDEVIGRHFSTFYPQEDVERGGPERALDTAAREGRYETEGWRVRKDGSRFRAHIVVDAIYQGGELVGFAKITRDITERYQGAEHRRQAEQALAQAQKVAAIGQLTLGVAHDFNNLLAVIATSLDQLSRAEGRRKEVLIDAARQAADRGARLTRQMLAFARGQRLEPKLHDANALIDGSIEIYRRAAGPITQCTVELVQADTRIMVDAEQLEAALVNLVANARDAMERPGNIHIA